MPLSWQGRGAVALVGQGVGAHAPSHRKSLEARLEALRPAFQGEVSIEGGWGRLLELGGTENTVVGCLPPPLSLERESAACLALEDSLDIENLRDPQEGFLRLPPCLPLEERAKDFSWDK